jgi:hypothetical protein
MRRLAAVLALALVGGVAGPARAAGGLPPIKHVFIIVLENKSFDESFGFGSGAPYLSQMLPKLGALVPNYYGVTHESLGNYIALVSGQGSNPVTQADCPVFLDLTPGSIGADGQAGALGCVYPPGVKTVADQLSTAGRTWRGYMEDMGTACRHPAIGSVDDTQTARAGDEYAARHNPFVYFHSLLDSGACAANDLPLDRLSGDLASISRTPNYSLITPNLCDDGHDASCVGSGAVGGLPGIDRFLRTWVPRITSSPAYRRDGLLVIAFDESDGTDASACCGEPSFPWTPSNGGPTPGPGGGRTGAVLLSRYIDPGTIDTSAYNHFSLLRSVEDLFGLGHLGFAAQGGLQSLGSDAFTCFAPPPRVRRGLLRRGSLIKLAVIGQGTQARPSVEAKLWFAGRLSVKAFRLGRRHGQVLRARRAARCQLVEIRLPYQHGKAVVSARALEGVERRTLRF